MFHNKSTLLLDMNSTFMFGEDNFTSAEDFFKHYSQLDGAMKKDEINSLIRSLYGYLEERYPDIHYRENFPSLESAIIALTGHKYNPSEMANIIDTFAYHEIGQIPDEYIEVLHKLSEKFTLTLVIDIWSPKKRWLQLFANKGISELFKASSYSSDHGMVKPSPQPFLQILKQLNVDKQHCLVIGDSVRRDLGGAVAAGIDCVLVGDNRHPDAIACYNNLIEFYNAL